MFIQTEPTPNPNSLKFIPGVPVLPGDTASFHSLEEARGNSPLATELLLVEDVTSVFLADDFVTVTKSASGDWGLMKPEILTLIMEHFVAGLPVMKPRSNLAAPEDANTDPLIREIKELIDTRVRPAVAQDGGDIVFHGFENGIVKLELHGSCSGCPSSRITLKNGIENMLRHYVPEVIAVEAVE